MSLSIPVSLCYPHWGVRCVLLTSGTQAGNYSKCDTTGLRRQGQRARPAGHPSLAAGGVWRSPVAMSTPLARTVTSRPLQQGYCSPQQFPASPGTMLTGVGLLFNLMGFLLAGSQVPEDSSPKVTTWRVNTSTLI